MDVLVKWNYSGPSHPSFRDRGVLYAYLHPRSQQVLYLGKADRCSVRERWGGEHKQSVKKFISEEFGVEGVHAIVGYLHIPIENRFSSALLSDVESLLIGAIQPVANIQSVRSRICRPGLSVTCGGSWPLRKKRFLDVDVDSRPVTYR